MTQPTRIEHDLLGDRELPAAAYYGVHTLRALENFPITGTAISIYPDLIAALRAMGHPVEAVDQVSGTHGIVRTPHGLAGGADPRREGTALGGWLGKARSDH